MAAGAAEAAQSAELAQEDARQGRGVVVQAAQAILQVRDMFSALREDMHRLGERTEGIGQIMAVIFSDIASTNSRP